MPNRYRVIKIVKTARVEIAVYLDELIPKTKL